jgi:hypothetical protein
VLRKFTLLRNQIARNSEVGPVARGTLAREAWVYELDIGAPGAREYHHLELEKSGARSNLTGPISSVRVLASEARTGPAPNARALAGNHATLAAGHDLALRLQLGEAFKHVTIESSLRPTPDTFESLHDRYHYRYVFEGEPENPGAAFSLSTLIAVTIDSRTGALLELNAKPERIARIVPL